MEVLGWFDAGSTGLSCGRPSATLRTSEVKAGSVLRIADSKWRAAKPLEPDQTPARSTGCGWRLACSIMAMRGCGCKLAGDSIPSVGLKRSEPGAGWVGMPPGRAGCIEAARWRSACLPGAWAGLELVGNPLRSTVF